LQKTYDFSPEALDFVVEFEVRIVHLVLGRLPFVLADLAPLQPRLEEIVAVFVLLPHFFLPADCAGDRRRHLLNH